MAFNTDNAASNVGNTNTNNDSWKAQGFLNFFIPGKDGKTKKIGAIGLKDSKPNEKELMNWLNADPANVQKLLKVLTVTYQSAVPTETSGFALPD